MITVQESVSIASTARGDDHFHQLSFIAKNQLDKITSGDRRERCILRAENYGDFALFNSCSGASIRSAETVVTVSAGIRGLIYPWAMSKAKGQSET